MKKLAIIIASASLAFGLASSAVFACPHEEGGAKTAEKPKDEKGTTTDKAKETPKKPEKKDEGATTAKKKEEPKQDTTKKPDKVSQK